MDLILIQEFVLEVLEQEISSECIGDIHCLFEHFSKAASK